VDYLVGTNIYILYIFYMYRLSFYSIR